MEHHVARIFPGHGVWLSEGCPDELERHFKTCVERGKAGVNHLCYILSAEGLGFGRAVLE